MIKTLVIFAGLSIVAAFFLLRGGQNLDIEGLSNLEPTPSVQAQTVEYQYHDQLLNISWLKVADTRDLSLLPNFDEKLTLNEALKINECRQAVNGGFYDEEGRAIGLFISEGELIQRYRANATFNGFLVSDWNGAVDIVSSPPETPVKFTLQTGPLLFLEGTPHSLRLKNDSLDRRMVAAKTDDDELYFIAVYSKESVFSGPNLVDLPRILEDFGERQGIGFESAINLDGGTASVFHSEEVSLNAVAPFGSIFCVK